MTTRPAVYILTDCARRFYKATTAQWLDICRAGAAGTKIDDAYLTAHAKALAGKPRAVKVEWREWAEDFSAYARGVHHVPCQEDIDPTFWGTDEWAMELFQCTDAQITHLAFRQAS